MTLLWFIVWLVANTLGDPEHITLDPVNFWAGALLLSIAVDLGGQHAYESSSRKRESV